MAWFLLNFLLTKFELNLPVLVERFLAEKFVKLLNHTDKYHIISILISYLSNILSKREDEDLFSAELVVNDDPLVVVVLLDV